MSLLYHRENSRYKEVSTVIFIVNTEFWPITPFFIDDHGAYCFILFLLSLAFQKIH